MMHELKVGDSVQSHYRARWYGQIREIHHYKHKMGSKTYEGFIAHVMILLDKVGHLQRKPKMMKINIGWLSKANFDVMEAYLDKKMEKYNV